MNGGPSARPTSSPNCNSLPNLIPTSISARNIILQSVWNFLVSASEVISLWPLPCPKEKWGNLLFPYSHPLSAFKSSTCTAPQSSFLLVEWDADWVMNYWIKQVRFKKNFLNLNLISYWSIVDLPITFFNLLRWILFLNNPCGAQCKIRKEASEQRSFKNPL